jgi:hypothetical protein
MLFCNESHNLELPIVGRHLVLCITGASIVFSKLTKAPNNIKTQILV